LLFSIENEEDNFTPVVHNSIKRIPNDEEEQNFTINTKLQPATKTPFVFQRENNFIPSSPCVNDPNENYVSLNNNLEQNAYIHHS
jgi:hypothetical protein